MHIIISSLLFALILGAADSTDKYEIKEINSAELDQIILERDGKILLINIWATWCIPCREEFPDLVKLSENYKEDLDVLAISVDYKDEIETKILPFIVENKVDFSIYINGFKSDTHLIDYFNKEWNGALPGTFIYDKKGRQAKFLEGKQSYKRIASIIDEMKKQSRL